MRIERSYDGNEISQELLEEVTVLTRSQVVEHNIPSSDVVSAQPEEVTPTVGCIEYFTAVSFDYVTPEDFKTIPSITWFTGRAVLDEPGNYFQPLERY